LYLKSDLSDTQKKSIKQSIAGFSNVDGDEISFTYRKYKYYSIIPATGDGENGGNVDTPTTPSF